MLGKLSGKLVNLQTGIVGFLEETTGEAELKARQPAVGVLASDVTESAPPTAGHTAEDGPADRTAPFDGEESAVGGTLLTEGVAEEDEGHVAPDGSLAAGGLWSDAGWAERSPELTQSPSQDMTSPSPDMAEVRDVEVPADHEDCRRLYQELEHQACLQAEQWAVLRETLHQQIEESLLREEAAQTECSRLRDQLAAQSGDRSHTAEQVRDLEQRLHAALRAEAHSRLEAETARETLGSLKAEFHKTQQKEERQLSIIRKDRDNLRKTLKALEKKAEQPGTLAASEEVQLLKEEGEKLSREVGLKNEKIKELLRLRKELETKAEDLASSLAELQGREQQWMETRAQCEELQAQCKAQSQELESREHALRAAENHIRKLKSQLHAADNSREVQKVELARAWEEREEELLRELDGARHSLEDISREADARVTAAQWELEEAHRRAADAERRVVELTNAVPEAMEPLQQRIAALEAQLAPFLEGRFDKEQRIAQLQSSMEQLQGRLRQSESELRSNTEKQVGLQRAGKEAQEQVASSRQEAQRLSRQLLETQGAKDVLATQLEEQRRQLAATMAQLRTVQQELGSLQEAHRQLLAQRALASPPLLLQPPKPRSPSPTATPKQPLTEAPRDVPEPVLQTSLQQVNEAKDHLQKELYKYIVENADLKKRLAQVEAMKARHADLDHRYNVLLDLLGEKEEECQELRMKLSAAGAS
eukprot:GGOE01043502.1.p1 GENE.GGOE01043502.1~~GGOE01043502.1.p1  ORF type:complete len:709 (+),score=254.59 GGOE01043502.1:121-2247(+)